MQHIIGCFVSSTSCQFQLSKKALSAFLALRYQYTTPECHNAHKGSKIPPRNYRLKRNGNLANFFSYFCNGKRIKELFASTLNGTAASVRCVSSMIVVLNTKLTRLVVATKKTAGNEEARQKCRFC